MKAKPTRDNKTLPTNGNIKQYVNNRLFKDTIDTLDSHIDRKKAIADALRYSILYLLYEFEELQRKELTKATGKDSNGLQHHLRDLLEANLISQIPAPEDKDGRLTYYRINTLGKQEIESDIKNITGDRPLHIQDYPEGGGSSVEPQPGIETHTRGRSLDRDLLEA